MIDKDNDGSENENLVNDLLNLSILKPIIYFGGLNTIKKIQKILKCKKINAIAIGNSLNYSEHRVQK